MTKWLNSRAEAILVGAALIVLVAHGISTLSELFRYGRMVGLSMIESYSTVFASFGQIAMVPGILFGLAGIIAALKTAR